MLGLDLFNAFIDGSVLSDPSIQKQIDVSVTEFIAANANLADTDANRITKFAEINKMPFSLIEESEYTRIIEMADAMVPALNNTVKDIIDWNIADQTSPYPLKANEEVAFKALTVRIFGQDMVDLWIKDNTFVQFNSTE